MGCSVAQFLVLGMIMIYCFTKISTWQWDKIRLVCKKKLLKFIIRFNYSAQEFPVSVGVIVFSYTSQLFLPSLEGDMEKRGDFKVLILDFNSSNFLLENAQLDAFVCCSCKGDFRIGVLFDMG